MSRRRAIVVAVVAALALGGCQTVGRKKPLPAPEPPPQPPAPLIIIRSAPPPVAAAPPPRPACVPKALTPPPRYPDTDAALRAAGGAADRYQLLAAGRILRQQRLEELERIISGCR